MVEMTQRVDIVKLYPDALAVALQPLKGCLRIHRSAVPLGEQPVVILPLGAEPFSLALLLRLEAPEHIHYRGRHL